MIQMLCFSFQSFLRFWERHRFNWISVREFPDYLLPSLPSGLCCVMSYLMQADKQCACADGIKETE